MIVDTSALVALLREEPTAPAIRAAFDATPRRAISAATVLELSLVMTAFSPGVVDELLRLLGLEILPVDAEHLRWARVGHERYGRGSGSPARLNYGDCFSYAAARATDRPLLFVGDDFVHADVEPALRR